jgi:hypothetical protein
MFKVATGRLPPARDVDFSTSTLTLTSALYSIFPIFIPEKGAIGNLQQEKRWKKKL